MNHAGEISRLVELAEPDVRVWTNVGDAHLGHFASLEAIADAKAEILEGAGPADACSWSNADDARVMARVDGVCRASRSRSASSGAPTSARRDVDDRGRRRHDAHVCDTPAGER